MSNLLEQASLVLIPSGYAEDIVYSEIPLDGSGDMVFTRASNGTRVNFDGLVEVTPWNFVEQSSNLASWTTAGVTIVTGIIDAFGTTNAVTMGAISSGSNTDYIVKYSNAMALPTGTQINYSVYLKGSGTIGVIIERSVSGDYFYQQQGVTLTNAWVRYDFAYTIGVGINANGISFYVSNLTGTTATSVDICFPQINYGSTAKPYFPTTDRLNVPRLTYQNGGGGCPSLLLEKQSTNETNYSEQFDNAYWYKNYQSVTANATISPDGTQNADLLIPSAGTGDHYILSGTVSNASGQVVTVSLFVKKKDNDYFYFGTGGASAFGAVVYQFSTNTFVVSGLSATATDYGNGWIRLSITGTTGATDLRLLFTPTDSSGSRTYNANGTDGTYIWGAQAEASSYPTSYIPTTSSSATRVADTCSKTGISSLIGQTEGTIFIDINRNYITSSYDRYFAVDDGDATIYRTGIFIIPEPSIDGRVYIEIRSNSVGIFGFTYNSTSVSNLKIAVAYKNNDMAIYINGTQSATSSASLTFAHTLSKIASYGNGQSIKESVIFPTRLTNSELASLTTI